MNFEELEKINNHSYRKEDLILIDLKISKNQEQLDYPNTITIIREFIRTLNDYQQLQRENQQLKNNWNELKNIIKQDINQSEQLIEECPRELKNTMIGTRSYETIIEYNKYILSKIQELEGKSE